jgi:hypothetical protein
VMLVRRAPGARSMESENMALLVANEMRDMAETGTDKHGGT